jgi:hypothetical protein
MPHRHSFSSRAPVEDLSMLGLDTIEFYAILVLVLVLFACFWGTLSRRELLGRTITSRPHKRSSGPLEHASDRASPAKVVPRAGDYFPAAHSENTALTIETSRWLCNMIHLLIQQGKFKATTATFLRSQTGDDAVLEHIYRVHVNQRQPYASEEESLVAACESVAGQQGSYASRR